MLEARANENVLSAQKVLSGSGHVERLYSMGKYTEDRLVARPEPDNNFKTNSTVVETVPSLKRPLTSVDRHKMGNPTAIQR